MGKEIVFDEVNRCLSCPVPRCQSGCPTENVIKSWIASLKNDDLEEAGRLLYEVNPFPELTSLLCDYDRQCKGHCIRGIKGESINIPLIENYIASNCSRSLEKKEPNGIKVALVGSGPANLSAAYFLAKDGYFVEIFEKGYHIGGMVFAGIPSFRFNKLPLDKIYEDLTSMGVKFTFGCEVGKDISLDELKDKYSFVGLGIGAEKENTFDMKANEGFVGGLSILYELNVLGKANEIKSKYHKVLVWGGGNVALDCARSLKRIIDETSIIYRRSKNEMPGNFKEVEDAEVEGVNFHYLENIESLILDDNGKLIGVNAITMKLGDLDESGRRSFIKIEGSEHVIDCDLVVAAIGEKPDFSNFSQISTEWDKFETNIENVFVLGDAQTGPKNIASAITQGRRLAKLISEKK